MIKLFECGEYVSLTDEALEVLFSSNVTDYWDMFGETTSEVFYEYTSDVRQKVRWFDGFTYFFKVSHLRKLTESELTLKQLRLLSKL
jgi:hypothetical protein